ncbi:MAG: hypothetical protein ACI837_000236 [Crocinitomicaceae bacterium]|jgi:hypothetical protein
MKIILSIFGLLFLMSSCVKNNPDPAWLEIGVWQLVENPSAIGEAGQLTENISDAWVYVNDELIGVFEVPCKVPILTTGTSVVNVYPTVLNNGISATKKIYPFLKPYQVTVELVANSTTTVNPVTSYYEQANFTWIENFDAAGFEITDDATSLTQMESVDDIAIIQPFNGAKFGRVTLDAVNNTWIGYTTGEIPLPQGEEVYIELDYHNTNRLITGLLEIGASGIVDHPNIQLNPQEPGEVVWKKMYIDLREIITSSPNAAYFEISFQALIDEGETTGEINIDNLKIVHF